MNLVVLRYHEHDYEKDPSTPRRVGKRLRSNFNFKVKLNSLLRVHCEYDHHYGHNYNYVDYDDKNRCHDEDLLSHADKSADFWTPISRA